MAQIGDGIRPQRAATAGSFHGASAAGITGDRAATTGLLRTIRDGSAG